MFYGKNTQTVRMEIKPIKNLANLSKELVFKNKYK